MYGRDGQSRTSSFPYLYSTGHKAMKFKSTIMLSNSSKFIIGLMLLNSRKRELTTHFSYQQQTFSVKVNSMYNPSSSQETSKKYIFFSYNPSTRKLEKPYVYTIKTPNRKTTQHQLNSTLAEIPRQTPTLSSPTKQSYKEINFAT